MGSKILITGDFVINRNYDISYIDQKIIALFNNSEFNIVNLEAPITTSNSKILKTGPHLKANEKSTLDVLKSLKVDAVTLANNHVLDYDEQGVFDTLDFCERNKFQTVGAGMNLEHANKTLFRDTREGKLAIVNFAENEWASSTTETAGANPMDIIENAKHIKDAKKRADYVFVIVHGGHEYYNLPSPRMQKQYRFYADQGADMIISHHTHCVSGHEVHNGVPIYYSLGNFLFTNSSSYEDWYLGALLEIEIKQGQISSKLHPIRQEKESFKLSLIKENEKDNFINRLSILNSIIEDSTQLKQKWDTYVEFQSRRYLNYWSPLSFIRHRYLRVALSKLGINGVNKNGISLMLNILRCEAHADLSKEVTQKYLRK